jgi:hypothetical protein
LAEPRSKRTDHDDHVAQMLDEAIGHIEHRVLRIPDTFASPGA